MFHRWVTPTYFGGLPVGYDMLNDPTDPSVGGSGVAAFADGIKSGGPNDGTYLVAFGEDATSSNANRGLRALCENTDFIDDILHRDLAISARTADTTAVGAVSSVVISGYVFVGEFGTSNTQDNRNRLVSVYDANDNEIIDSSGNTVLVSLIHDGSSNNVVGTEASGFRNGVTVAFSPSIPNGTSYRVYYNERSNLAELPKNALTSIIIRSAEEVDGGVQKLLRDLHAPAAAQAWDDPWDSTIRALASAGLNERYRRATTVAGSYTYDTAGNGAIIIRDGQAVEVRAPEITVGTTQYPDILLALYRASSASAAIAGGTFPLNTRGGDVGFYRDLDFNSTNDANEYSRPGLSGPMVLEAVPRDIRSATLDSDDARFYINNTSNATLNPASSGSTGPRRTIQCATGQHFRIPSGPNAGKTSIRCGLDLVEVTFTGAGQPATYIIDEITASNQILVRHMNGKLADFGATAITTARLRILQPTVVIGGSPEIADSGVAGFRGAVFSRIPHLKDGQDDDTGLLVRPALFLGGNTVGTDQALSAGYYNTSGTLVNTFNVQGDGALTSTARIRGMVLTSEVSSRSISAGSNTYTWDPYSQGGTLVLHTNAAVTTATTLTIQWSGDFTPVEGDELTVFMYFHAGSVGAVLDVFTATWPADIHFSGTDGTIPNRAVDVFAAVQYRLKYMQGEWWATRNDY